MPALDRPLIGRVERMVDGFERGSGRNLSTVYDPYVVAKLQEQVADLTASVKSLEERLRALEGSRGTTTSPTPAAPAVIQGFGTSPSSPAAPAPGFVPGLAPPGTNP